MNTGCSSLPPRSWHRQERNSGRSRFSFSFVISLCPFPLSFPGCALHFLGTGLGGGQREACTVPLHADCSGEPDCTYGRAPLVMI